MEAYSSSTPGHFILPSAGEGHLSTDGTQETGLHTLRVTRRWSARGRVVLNKVWSAVLLAGAIVSAAAGEKGFKPLFPQDGVPQGWVVRSWEDVKKPGPAGAVWRVEDGILHGSNPRGTWLVSEKEYGDFILEFDFLLGERGNSGCGLRFPPEGDPAFDGLELQMVDLRYYGGEKADPDTLTGSLYKAVAPRAQVFKPQAWNQYRIECKGAKIRVRLNGRRILDVDLDRETRALERGSPLSQRPRRGHIGFQELSRAGGHAQIRNARIKEIR